MPRGNARLFSKWLPKTHENRRPQCQQMLEAVLPERAISFGMANLGLKWQVSSEQYWQNNGTKKKTFVCQLLK